jgi:thioesterase domain-containing protein
MPTSSLTDGRHRSQAAAALERYLYAQIPISRALGVKVLRADCGGVLLAAPLTTNLNHRQTFFGGSAAALATLAAWALAHQKLLEEEELDVHLVIQRSRMEYLEPAAAEVEARCLAPVPEQWDRMLRTVQRRGRGRIELEVALRSEGTVVGSFKGSFVVLTDK